MSNEQERNRKVYRAVDCINRHGDSHCTGRHKLRRSVKSKSPAAWLGICCCLEIEALLDGFDLRLGGFDAALVVGGFLEAWILHLGVELNLGLGA